MMITIRMLAISSLLLLSIFLLSATASASVPACVVKSEWLTNPSLPLEVKKSGSDGTSNFCDFYQFSTQTFLYLMSPASNSKKRNFQVRADFPLLEYNADGSPGNSCDSNILGNTLRTSLAKSLSTGQAGSGSVIYAQDGNVIYYDVRFNQSLCGLTASAVEMQNQKVTNFPSGTIELKFAWKILSPSEIASNTFVMQEQLISGKPATLGLVGMHIASATADHPEFVWATYEHKINTPDCTPTQSQTGTNWMFASASCTKGLPGSAAPGNACKFNQPGKTLTVPKGSPTNICRVYPDGTASGDLKAAENISDITQQNAELLKLLKQSTTAPLMKVLENYFNVGALWVSNTGASSGGNAVDLRGLSS